MASEYGAATAIFDPDGHAAPLTGPESVWSCSSSASSRCRQRRVGEATPSRPGNSTDLGDLGSSQGVASDDPAPEFTVATLDGGEFSLASPPVR